MFFVAYTCHGQSTQVYGLFKAYKALGTPLQLYGHVVTVRQPFKLPIGMIFGHLATGGVWTSHYGVMLV